MAKGPAVAMCVVTGALLLLALFLFTCQGSEDDSDSEGDEDDEERAEHQLRALLYSRDETHRSCSMCWCCNSAVATFLGVVLAVTIIGGAVLWEMGVLQPIFAQSVMYVYITVVVAAFVSILVAQLWRLIRRVTAYIINEFQKLRSVFRIFGHKTKYKWRDLLDDGQLNSSYQGPPHASKWRRQRD